MDHSFKQSENSMYSPANKEYKLGFEIFMGLCKFGKQSFLNSWNSIASFLVTSATYFALFKNNNYCEYYDVKIEQFLQFSKIKRQARSFYEAVSINEINANAKAPNTINNIINNSNKNNNNDINNTDKSIIILMIFI